MALFLKHLFSNSSSVKCRTGSIFLKEKVVEWKFISNKKTISATLPTSLQQQQPLPKDSFAVGKSQTAQIQVGDRFSGFLVTDVEKVPEFQLIAVKLIHEATGGEYLHIDRNDSNNAFSVLFRTTPKDSTGLPHILEHTTLCGSRRYPCRDPFFKMLNRSLATFMNAMTAADYTMYPFSTQNAKDFENLMSVYLDSVFYPKLTELDFHQEGWRLEHEKPEDQNTPIILKGVVYNEMKGVFADNQNLFAYALQNNILPSHTYSVCSAGDPSVIPMLTHQDLKNFHKDYYSPRNTKYYTYGNFPLKNHLKFLNEQYLQKIELGGEVSTAVPPEKRWTQPVRKHIKCRIDPLVADKNKQSSIAISVLCCSITDLDECFLLKVLSELLVSGPNSSFYKTLIEPNIGAGFNPLTGYDSELRDTIFTVGLQGVSENDFERIIQLYEKTVDDVIRDGFDEKHLEAILHSIELNLKHQTSDFGLGLLFSVAPVWNHDGDVINFLKIENRLEKFKKSILEDPQHLQKTVKKYFKDNQHKLILTMTPDPKYCKEEAKKEEELLKSKLKKLAKEDKFRIYENGIKLMEEQKKDDKSCLPTLEISDLKKDIEKTKIKEEQIDGVKVYMIPQPTNGITYFRGLMTLGELPKDLKSYLPLFALISTKMGTAIHNYKEFDQLSTVKTGGLSVETHFKEDPKCLSSVEESLMIGSYCLNRNLPAMFDLWLEVFEEMELKDLERFETLVKAHAASLVNGVTSMGHYYAMLSAASLISPLHRIKENASGLAYINFIKKVARSDLNDVLIIMGKLKNELMTRSRLRCATNILEGTQTEVLQNLSNFILKAPGTVKESEAMKTLPKAEMTTKGLFHVLPIPVSYTSKALIAVPYEHEDYAALGVMSRLMTMKHLHPLIREKGGAYGSGLNLTTSGTLNYYSYRDPNPLNSHMVYDKAAEWLSRGEFSQEDVNEAKLGIFQTIDFPVPPGQKGMRWFLNGVTDESVQRHRLRTMKVTKDRVIEVGEKYLRGKNGALVGRTVIGPENKSVTENNSHNWEILTQE